ncbi:50S ribosomal protein L24e [Candidatus Woesearchaeota archaeon]|nr:50S ribosomal protein L24e [Candidatus Woesearchaeota archaeon]
MMRCSFCDSEFEYNGKVFVKKDGKPLFFCSGKCQKNMLKLNRKSRDLKWVTSKKK